jgi:hypothetical protein
MRAARPSFIVPLALVVIGGLLLLQNFGLLGSFDLVRFAPALLLLLGLQLLLRGDLGLTWEGKTFGITRGTVRTASLEANAAELDVRVRALRREGRLIAGQYSGRSRPDLEVRGEQARLLMRRGRAWAFSLADWEIGLARDLDWALLISTHLGEIDIDFQDLTLIQADLGTGFGDIKINMGGSMARGVRAGSTFGHIGLSVPDDVACLVRVRKSAVGRLLVDEKRFILVEDGLYATLGYQNAESVLFAELGTTFGNIRLN